MSNPENHISQAISSIESRLRTYETRYQRPCNSVSLLAVSKTKPTSEIRDAIAAGQRRFGENYVDEAVEKIQHFKGVFDAGKELNEPLEWHFIGQIQSRKSRTIAEHFDWAHGVDRLKVARRLSEARESLGNSTGPLNICLQVNVDREASKAGVTYEELDALADACADLPGLTLRGLMAIPAQRNDLESQRRVFAGLKEQFDLLKKHHANLDTLSIGMSGDLEAAVAEGATLVRVGTAIFGARAR